MHKPVSVESHGLLWNGRVRGSSYSHPRLLGAILLLAGMVSSAVLVTAPGTFDVTDPRVGFLQWMDDSVRYGLIEGYRWDPYDYPPGTKVLLGLAGRTGDAIGFTRLESLKFLLLLSQALTAAVAFAMTRSLLFAGCVWLATTTSAMGQGYLDIIYAPFLLASIFGLMRGRPLQAWVCLLVSCTVKPQPLVLVPFYLVHLFGIQSARDLWRVARSPTTWGAASWTAAAVLLFVVTFGRTDSGQWSVVQALQKATAHREVSGNAMNVPWIGSYVYQVVKDGKMGPARLRDTHWRGAIKTAAALILGGVIWLQMRAPKTPHTALLSLLTGYFAYFTFNAGVHENHLFIPMLLALVMAFGAFGVDQTGWDKRRTGYLLLAAGVIAFSHLNPLLFYDFHGNNRTPTLIGGENGLDVSVPLALFSIAIFVVAVRYLRRTTRQPLTTASAHAP